MTNQPATPVISGWDAKRRRLEDYFDRTAFDAWTALTSDAPVSRIRATVRAGREDMRNTLLSWLPQDLTGRRVLDAGCGTGALAVEAARRGAEVVGIDVSPQLIAIADERAPDDLRGRLSFRAGDMLDPALGRFDHIVSMDVFTFAPGTPLLRTARALGRFFPKSDRSPTIIPVGHDYLRARMSRSLPNVKLGRDKRVSRGFYTSHAQEVLTA